MTLYPDAFRKVLPLVFEKVRLIQDNKTKAQFERILAIWKQRKIYDDEFLDSLYSAMKPKPVEIFQKESPKYPVIPYTDEMPENISEHSKSIEKQNQEIESLLSSMVMQGEEKRLIYLSKLEGRLSGLLEEQTEYLQTLHAIIKKAEDMK
ncbi:hypothetical protein ROZALSC1DRAFT_31990, partial [Rozella allomycis CSF55]